MRNFADSDFFKQKDNRSRIAFLLRYAILAPSTHNSQPWFFDIQERACDIYADSSVNIIEADPRGRDLYISLGSCAENLVIAARYFGVFKSMQCKSGKKTEPVCRVEFANLEHPKVDSSYVKLLEAIKTRVNTRGIFEKRALPASVVTQVASVLGEYKQGGVDVVFETNKAHIERLASLTAEGLKKAYRSKAFRKEMSQWMHHSFTSKRYGLPGYALNIPLLLSFVMPTIVKFFNIGAFLGKLNYVSFASAPLACVLSTKENEPGAWVEVGRVAERLMLEFRVCGARTSVFVASIEMGFASQIKKLLGLQGNPQFLFIVGYMKGGQKPSPRFALETKIVHAR